MGLPTAPGRRQRLTDELRRARAANGGWIDTDFYKNFMQVTLARIYCFRSTFSLVKEEERSSSPLPRWSSSSSHQEKEISYFNASLQPISPEALFPPCQRENREDYIAKLEHDLASLPAGQADENDSDDEWMSSKVRLVAAADHEVVDTPNRGHPRRPLMFD